MKRSLEFLNEILFIEFRISAVGICPEKIKTNKTLTGKQVDKFTYLGQTTTNDGRCEEEIKNRITIAKKQCSLMKNVLTNRK